MHTSYHQAVASTGRLSSSDPNLQNIPIRTAEGRRVRQAFVPEDGWRMVAADYSQIELRIMAHLSGDDGLQAAFASGADIHRATAAEVFELAPDAVGPEHRRRAKAINFGLIYGMSAFGLGRQLGIGRNQAQAYVDLYFARYPGVRRFMDETRTRARERGFVETVFGRRLHLPEINSRNIHRRQYAERTAINAPMQGTAADIIKRAMVQIDRWLGEGSFSSRMNHAGPRRTGSGSPRKRARRGEGRGAGAHGDCRRSLSAAGGRHRRRGELGRSALSGNGVTRSAS